MYLTSAKSDENECLLHINIKNVVYENKDSGVGINSALLLIKPHIKHGNILCLHFFSNQTCKNAITCQLLLVKE